MRSYNVKKKLLKQYTECQNKSAEPLEIVREIYETATEVVHCGEHTWMFTAFYQLIYNNSADWKGTGFHSSFFISILNTFMTYGVLFLIHSCFFCSFNVRKRVLLDALKAFIKVFISRLGA